MWTGSSRRIAYYIGIIAILGLALFLRLYGHNWDGGWYLQPDARDIVMVLTERIHAPSLSDLGALLDPAHSPLNPRSNGANGQPQSFAYGSLPLYATDLLAWLFGLIAGTNLNNYDHVGQVGRYLTELLDTGTVVLAMIFARKAYGRLGSLFAGALLAATVTMVQLAHFFTVDAWVTFFCTALLLVCLKLYQRPEWKWAALTGVMFGMALATKVSVIELAIPILVTLIAAFRNRGWPDLIEPVVKHLAVSAAATVATFAIFNPYAILQPSTFINDANLQWLIVTGRYDVPFTRQFVGDIPVRYEIGNLVHWGLGPFLGLAMLFALGYAIWRWRSRKFVDVLLLSWILPYFALIATAEAKFPRYLEPIVPALVLLTVGCMVELLPRHRPIHWRSVAVIFAVAVVFLGTFAWAAAFESIYSHPNPRITASKWIYQNIRGGSTISAEYWDDALPLPLAGEPYPVPYYSRVTMDLYADRPNEKEFEYIANALQHTDYIILSSDRLAQSIPKLPWRYPVDSEYYRLLENGQLGYQEVYESDVMPELFGMKFNDRNADESFTVYDHPHIRIFKKVETLSTSQLRQRFAAAIAQPWDPVRSPSQPTLLLTQPVDQRPVAHDLGWSSTLTHFSIAAALIWFLVLALIGLASSPLTLVLFSRFSDLGWGFSRILGLIVTGFGVWICVSLQLVHFRVPNILIPIALVVAAMWFAFRGTLRDHWPAIRSHWRMILITEIVFAGAFSFFLLLRAINPDLWQTYYGGEKPMEMSFISAIGRSAVFPPYDPWYANGVMNYYYYGFYLIAYLWKLTGIPPEIGFQLGVATVSGTMVSGVFSLVSTFGADLIHSTKLRWAVAAGLIGVLIHSFMGNLDAVAQLLSASPQAFDFWHSRSVVDYAITEFPYFTQMWADLHPHFIDLPIAVLMLALVYSRIRKGLSGPRDIAIWAIVSALVLGTMAVTNSWDMPLGLLLVGAALVSGALRHPPIRFKSIALALGVWVAIGGLAYTLFLPFFSRFVVLVSGIARTQTGSAPSQFLNQFGIFLGILACGGIVAAIGRVHLRRNDVLAGALSAAAGIAAAFVGSFINFQPDVFRFLVMVVLAGTAGALLPALVLAVVDDGSPLQNLAYLTPIAAATIGLLVPVRPTAAMLCIPLLVGVLIWLCNLGRPALALMGLLIAGASGVTLGTDLVYVVDDLSGSPWERMNTVFKFFMQGWTLFAIAGAGVMIWLLWTVWQGKRDVSLGIVAGPHPDTLPAAEMHSTNRLTAARIAIVLSASLVAAGLVYPIVGTPQRLSLGMPGSPDQLTLNGLTWMKGSWIYNTSGQRIDFTGDYYAIMWLRQHDTNNGIIAEASIGPYRGNGSRISAGTGLPTVLGWDSHERQQRYSPGIDQRLIDVRTLYNTPDIAVKQRLIEKYDISYIVVGDVEREWEPQAGFAGDPLGGQPYASAAGLAALKSMVGSELTVAFQYAHTTVYKVIPFPSIPPALSARAQP